MTKTALLLLLAAAAPGVSAESFQISDMPQGPAFEQWVVQGIGNGPGKDFYGSRTKVSTPFSKGRCRIGAETSSFRAQSDGRWRKEYSAFFSRELYHVKAIGRIATSPPETLRAGYHLAQGEAIFTIYGFELGPEHAGLSSLVWESSGPVPASLDTTWVSTFHLTYTNTNHHLEPKLVAVTNPAPPPGVPPKVVGSPGNELVLVQNTWQFELRETWRQRTSLAVEAGGSRYNNQVPDGSPRVFLNNVQYHGNVFAIDGWHNNHVSAEASQIVGHWKAWGGFTRLNILDNELNFLYGGGLDFRPDAHWRFNAGYYYNRRRRTATSRALSLGISYLW